MKVIAHPKVLSEGFYSECEESRAVLTKEKLIHSYHSLFHAAVLRRFKTVLDRNHKRIQGGGKMRFKGKNFHFDFINLYLTSF